MSKIEDNSFKIKSKDEILMDHVCKFFKDVNNTQKMMHIVSGQSKISLRILDWFITNYAKYSTIHFTKKNDKSIFVHLDYKKQLKAYSKKLFDPFCRRERIKFITNDKKEIITTVGQLNFFRWAITNDIITYVENNLEIIENDMNSSMKKLYKNKGKTKGETRRIRKDICVKATQSINKHHVKIVVDFN